VFRPAILDRHTLTLDVAAFVHALPEGGNQAWKGGRRRAAEVSDDRQLRRLLRACRKRPRRRCAAEQGDELAPSHELPSEEARNLSHHWTMRALCIAAKYSRLSRFRVQKRPR